MSYYQSVNYGPRLPVNPEQPDPQCGTNATPNLRMDLGQMTDFLPALADALVIETQNQVGKNATRTFAFNLWGRNGYLNQEFAEILGVFAMHCESVIIRTNGDPIQVIQGEAAFFLNAAMGMLVQQYPDLAGFLPPEAEGHIRGAQRDWAELTRNIRAVQSQYQQRSSFQGNTYNQGYNRGMPGSQAAPMQGGMGFNGMRGQNQVQGGNQRPIWDQGTGGQSTYTAQPGNNGFNRAYAASPAQSYQPTQRTVVTPEPATPARAAAPTTAPATAQFESKARLIQPGEKTMPASDVLPTKTPTPTPLSASAAQPKQFNRVPLDDGTELYAAVNSPYKVIWTPQRPPLAFDREKYLLFHRVTPNPTEDQVALQESLQNRIPGMDYLDHELDEGLKRIYRNQSEFSRHSGPPQMATLSRIVPNETGRVGTLVSEERLKALDAAKAPRTLQEPMVADSIEGGMAEAHLEILRHGGNGKTLEFLLKQCREYCLEAGAYSRVLELKRCDTYESLLDKLVTFGLEYPDSELTDICNERLTRAFNRFMTKSMYFNWSIDNLIEDYPDAKAKVDSSCGELLQAQFARSVRYVIDQALHMLDEDELNTWFQRHLPDEAADSFEEPVVFANPLTVTTVPWTMYELEKRFRLEGLVTKERASELFDALEAIFLRTTDPSASTDAQTCMKLREHVIVTSDNHRLYARASYLSPGLQHYGVTLEPPVIIPPREARA